MWQIITNKPLPSLSYIRRDPKKRPHLVQNRHTHPPGHSSHIKLIYFRMSLSDFDRFELICQIAFSAWRSRREWPPSQSTQCCAFVKALPFVIRPASYKYKLCVCVSWMLRPIYFWICGRATFRLYNSNTSTRFLCWWTLHKGERECIKHMIWMNIYASDTINII